jgi:hypothetical protein
MNLSSRNPGNPEATSHRLLIHVFQAQIMSRDEAIAAHFAKGQLQECAIVTGHSAGGARTAAAGPLGIVFVKCSAF